MTWGRGGKGSACDGRVLTCDGCQDPPQGPGSQSPLTPISQGLSIAPRGVESPECPESLHTGQACACSLRIVLGREIWVPGLGPTDFLGCWCSLNVAEAMRAFAVAHCLFSPDPHGRSLCSLLCLPLSSNSWSTPFEHFSVFSDEIFILLCICLIVLCFILVLSAQTLFSHTHSHNGMLILTAPAQLFSPFF